MPHERMARLTPYMFAAPAAVVMIVALFYPIAYMVWGSFRDWDPSQSLGETEFVGLANYAKLLVDPAFHASFWVTLVFAFTVVAVEMVLWRRVLGAWLWTAIIAACRCWPTNVSIITQDDRSASGRSGLALYSLANAHPRPICVRLRPNAGSVRPADRSDWLGARERALSVGHHADIWQWTPRRFYPVVGALAVLAPFRAWRQRG